MNTAQPVNAAVQGRCDEGFERVREAFEGNFAQGDLGASCAVTVDGELVVDLWGGHRDLARRFPWERDTLVNVWSTTKMMTALCVLMLHDRGELSLDEPVARYWPEFGDQGKAEVLVRHVMGHTAGLPVFDDPPNDEAVFDWEGCCARLAAQAPRWRPGDGSGYHAETQGWLLGEVIRRVDGRTVGRFFRDEVAQPAGIDFYIGLPDTEHARVAEMSVARAEVGQASGPELRRSSHASSIRSAGLVNTSSWRRAELAASNGHGNARSVALAMSPFANGGKLQGRSLLSAATIERAFEVQADGIDRIAGRHFRLGIGYGLNGPGTPLGVNDRTLWWAGWGGSMCVVDVENRMAVSYTMNRMQGEGDFRAAAVIFAAHESLASTN